MQPDYYVEWGILYVVGFGSVYFVTTAGYVADQLMWDRRKQPGYAQSAEYDEQQDHSRFTPNVVWSLSFYTRSAKNRACGELGRNMENRNWFISTFIFRKRPYYSTVHVLFFISYQIIMYPLCNPFVESTFERITMLSLGTTSMCFVLLRIWGELGCALLLLSSH